MAITGRCLCGRVQYTCNAEPMFMRLCHCTDCQRFTGSAFLTAVAVPVDAVTVSGTVKIYTQPGGTTGLPINRSFCPECGSPLTVSRAGTGRMMLMGGTLDDTSFVNPGENIFCDSKQAWVRLSPDIPSFPGPS